MNPTKITLGSVEDFPLLKKSKMVYLDNSATTQKPKVVINALVNFYEKHNANVHRGIYSLSEDATILYENAREKVAHFIGANTNEIIFTKGTTESLNLLATCLGSSLKRGDEIVLSEMEHHSNLVPWQQMALKIGIKLSFIPFTSDFRLDLKVAKKLITSKTKIVSITHMSNVLGTINPIDELAKLAHAVGALFVVDAAQSVPHLPVDVKKMNCDFLAFSSHKMCGPMGIGVLYGRYELLEKLPPYQFGGGMIKDVSQEKSTFADPPTKFEAGTPPVAQAIAFGAAIEYLEEVGMENIYKHGQEIASYALKKLSNLSFVKIIGPLNTNDRGPIISFTVDKVHAHDVSEILNRHHIAVRAGTHCAMPLLHKLKLTSAVRASFYIYNTTSDVDALIAALKDVKKVLM